MIEPGFYNDIPPMIYGTNYEWGIIIEDASGVIKDLTGSTVEVVLSNADGTVDVLTAGDGLVIYATQGIIIIVLDDSDVATYPLGEIVCKVYITEINGETNLYLEGRIPVRE